MRNVGNEITMESKYFKLGTKNKSDHGLRFDVCMCYKISTIYKKHSFWNSWENSTS